MPVVIDYGYYAPIGPKTLSAILLKHGVTRQMIAALLEQHAVPLDCDEWPDCLPAVIDEAGLPAAAFGRLLYHVETPFLDPFTWVDRAAHQWQTIKEKTYPTLHDQARLSRLYPDYDEVLFPQRIEEYTFALSG